ncbi:MAG TPA: nucleoside hydrolase [Chloroflexi bacterium]|nr:nucleoside hydrolase [Chloroflexota bacterium]
MTIYPELSDAFITERLTHPRSGPLPVILDTDTANELDDQFALAWAVLSKDSLNLQAVHVAPFFNEKSTSPADGQRKSFDEATAVLAALGENSLPVRAGSEAYLPDKATPVESPAARDLIERAMQHDPDGPPLYVATIGCLTNPASAILLEPEIIKRIVIVMLAGQDFEWPTAREFNLQQDIPAMQVIFESGVPLVHISAVRQALTLGLTYPEVKEYVKGCGTIGDLLADRYEQQSNLTPGYRRPIWDLSAIAWLINPDWAVSTLRPRPRLTEEGYWSQDFFGKPVRQVVQLDVSGIFMDLFARLAELR